MSRRPSAAYRAVAHTVSNRQPYGLAFLAVAAFALWQDYEKAGMAFGVMGLVMMAPFERLKVVAEWLRAWKGGDEPPADGS